MEKYEINDNTVAVVGVNDTFSQVIEKDKNYFINDNSYSIMEHSCEYFGSSYSGRMIGSKKMIGVNYKVPIIIEESKEIIFFPLTDITNSKCIWISLKWFDHVDDDYETTFIYLKNGKKIKTKISKYSIENQVLRASKLNLVLNQRKKDKI